MAFIESLSCDGCGLELGLHPPTLTMRAAPAQGTDVDGSWWFPCANRLWECNWLAAADSGSGQCVSCRLTRTRPSNDDTLALEKLATASGDKRRLLVQLADLGLPITPWYDRKGGLGFDLLSSRSNGARVTIGHANGIVTIDLAESLDAHREAMRIRLGEPYRTMLGHFRHEVGHYYEWILVESAGPGRECRRLFGDERASYTDAIDRHYRLGRRGTGRRPTSPSTRPCTRGRTSPMLRPLPAPDQHPADRGGRRDERPGGGCAADRRR